MLKLLVADDERILREAVCYLIDWKSIGIELAASCKTAGRLMKKPAGQSRISF